MAPLVIEGDTLGQKHKNFNKLVHEAVFNRHAIEATLSEDDDVQNLLKIDVACKTRNVEFLLEVLKSEDLLYVSRAIKNSKWLITDKQYSHIVNPEYLHTQLFPEVTTKASNKLMLSIRLNLKDAERVEEFYKYVSVRNRKASYKWLQNCSVPFVENEFEHIGDNIPDHLLRRLFEKSFSIFEKFAKTQSYKRYRLRNATVFFVNTDTEKYLDALKIIDCNQSRIKCNPKATATLMTRCPDRILDNFEYHAAALHLPTFVKHLKQKQDIESFLLENAENDNLRWFYTYKNIKPFIKQMPENMQFEFVNKFFINKESIGEDGAEIQTSGNIYEWYKLAPFDVAFPELKKLIRATSSPIVRIEILQVLISVAGRNMTHVRALLKYFKQKHTNEPFKFKIQFVNTFISKHRSHEFDTKTWNLLNQLYQNLEVYIESENNVQSCIKSIIIRHVIRGEKVPDIINEKFKFYSMKEYQYKLKKQKDKDAVFAYLYDYVLQENKMQKINTQSDLEQAVRLCKKLLNLLIDWNKELQNCPYVINRVKELHIINQEKSWNAPINSLYNVSKSWKKVMFEDSILLNPTQEVCVNALKHDTGLLVRHKEEVEALLIKDNRLTGLLKKVRVFWPNSFGEEWKTLYLNCLEKPSGSKTFVIGLITLLNQKELNDIAKKYVPTETKIDWSDINELVLSIQKQIAKNMSKARPLCALENILLYAKGDYLQFAVHSLEPILNQLSAHKIRQFLPQLLDSPISLQKFGVRHACGKLHPQELKPIFKELWNSTNNSTIRKVLFTQTRTLLSENEDIWDLLSMFIDTLSHEENKVIYKTLGNPLDPGHSIRPKLFMKSFTFLKSLPKKACCGPILKKMEKEALDIMEILDDDFIANIILKDIDKNFTKSHDNIYKLTKVAAFILSCKDEDTAARRYEMFLAPLLDRNLPLWNEVNDGEYHVKINLIKMMSKIVSCIDDFNLSKNIKIPVETYKKILTKLEAYLSPQRDYVFLTTWKLAVEFVKLVEEHKDIIRKSYADLHLNIAPHFAQYCIGLLKEDFVRFYPSIHILFAEALKDFFSDYMPYKIFQTPDRIEYIKCILQNSNDKEVYVMVYLVLPRKIEYLHSDIEIQKWKEICKILYLHPSEELKMHYYQLFNEYYLLEDSK